MPIIPALSRLRQKDCRGFKVSLSYKVRPGNPGQQCETYLRKEKKKKFVTG